MCRTPTRVCVIYGSESGTAERGIRNICKKWLDKKSPNFVIVDTLDGRTAASKKLATLADEYDILVVATSSNGEGDPPWNFHSMLCALYLAIDAEEKPLAGLQHAVLGFGSSNFDTFQNCPRIADKLLGECGSRRMVMRAECDECEEDAGDSKMKVWSEAVFNALQTGAKGKNAEPVCDWTEPGDQLLDKHDEMVGGAGETDSMGTIGIVCIIVGILLSGIVAYVINAKSRITN